MTNEDIIRMAREAGWRVDSEGEILEGDGWHIQTDIVERFAALVAAAEREACAQVCLMPADEIQITDDCSEYVYKDYLDCAEAIRARGEDD
jgi:hypothetical protein